MADRIGSLLGGIAKTNPLGPQSQFAQSLTTAATAGQHSPEYYRIAASYEGSAAKAESMAADLATFKDQPQILNDLVERDPYWQKNPKGKTYLLSLLGLEPVVRPETLPPAQRARTYAGETEQLLGRLGGMRAGLMEDPEALSRWTQALTPGMQMQQYPTVGFAPTGLTPEQQAGFKQFSAGLFGGPITTARQAAGYAVRGEEIPAPAERFSQWMGMKGRNLSEVNDDEQALVAFLTEGPSVFPSFPGRTEQNIAERYPSLMADEKLKTQLGITKDALTTFDPIDIKKQTFMGRMAVYINLVNSLRGIDEESAAYIFWNWFDDIFAGAAPTPSWAKLGWEK